MLRSKSQVELDTVIVTKQGVVEETVVLDRTHADTSLEGTRFGWGGCWSCARFSEVGGLGSPSPLACNILAVRELPKPVRD